MMTKKKTDLVLLHPPSVYDFREMLIVPGPIADLVPSGPFFEMYPLGFSFLGEYLERHGFKVRVVNLAARMVAESRFDVERAIGRMKPSAFGIGFHWLPHAQGAVEVARICKRLHPETPVILGGYSASIFHAELMEYPEIDYVVRGDSGEEPLRALLAALGGDGDLGGVTNLTRRDDGQVVSSEIEFVPPDLSHLGDNYLYMLRSAIRNVDHRGIRAFAGWWSYPMGAVLTVKGCRRNCSFCGGSARAMSRCFNRKGIALRSPADVARDLRSIASFTGAPIFVIGDIRQPGGEYASEVLERVRGLKVRNHVVLELFEPAPPEFFREVARALSDHSFEISPETHDDSLRRLAGKPYTAEEMEESIAHGLGNGCGRFDVFFMIGLEGQDPGSVMDTVGYCDRLIARFGGRVNPLIGPLAPFLDPGSIAREESESHGYRVLLHTLEDHMRALEEPHWRDLLGYETRWMSRQDIVDVTYKALRELNAIKRRHGLVSARYADGREDFLDGSVRLLDRLDRAGALEGPERTDELQRIEGEARELRARCYMVKDELEWPVRGFRFRWGGIASRLVRERTRR